MYGFLKKSEISKKGNINEKISLISARSSYGLVHTGQLRTFRRTANTGKHEPANSETPEVTDPPAVEADAPTEPTDAPTGPQSRKLNLLSSL